MNSILAVLLLLTCASAQDANDPNRTSNEEVMHEDPSETDESSGNNSVTEEENGPKLSGRIINGATAQQGNFPWQALIYMDDIWLCGGSIISEEWILTAAHCVRNYTNFEIYLGKTIRDEYQKGEERRTTTTKIWNEEYHGFPPNYNLYDIGLLKVDTITFSSIIKPIQLPRKSDASQNYVGTQALVSGFGRTESGEISNTLQYAIVTVVSNYLCDYEIQRYVADNTLICATGEDRQGVFSGDSGGALVNMEEDGFVEIGITSFAPNKTYLDGPDGYTRVTAYLDWINEKTGIPISD